jgi:hypothetical protein
VDSQRRLAGLILSMTLLAANAQAQTNPASAANSASGEDSTKNRLETVIVTGEREKEDQVPVQATYTQSSINDETILNLSPGSTTTVQTLLNLQPSIYAESVGPNGMRTDIHFRAFVDGQFGETFGGIPLNDDRLGNAEVHVCRLHIVDRNQVLGARRKHDDEIQFST